MQSTLCDLEAVVEELILRQVGRTFDFVDALRRLLQKQVQSQSPRIWRDGSHGRQVITLFEVFKFQLVDVPQFLIQFE